MDPMKKFTLADSSVYRSGKTAPWATKVTPDCQAYVDAKRERLVIFFTIHAAGGGETCLDL